MRAIVLCALLVTACGGGASKSFGPTDTTLTVSASGTITTPEGTVSASGDKVVGLTDFRAPKTLTFSMSGGGRVVAAEADALIAALDGKQFSALDGSELQVDQVFNGDGAIAEGGSQQDLSFAYVVQSYRSLGQPVLTVVASASSAGNSVSATLTLAAY